MSCIVNIRKVMRLLALREQVIGLRNAVGMASCKKGLRLFDGSPRLSKNDRAYIEID